MTQAPQLFQPVPGLTPDSAPGLVPNRSALLSGQGDAPGAPRRPVRSPLLDVLPEAANLRAYFSAVRWGGLLAAGGAPSTATGQPPLAFGLRSFRIPDDGAQELGIVSVEWELRSADNGTAPNPEGDPIAEPSIDWYNPSGGEGTSGHVVVGIDLPVVEGGWTQGPFNLPAIRGGDVDSGNTGRSSRAIGAPDRIVWHSSMPPGRFRGPGGRDHGAKTFAPAVVRVPAGSRLDVAMVFDVRTIQPLGGAGWFCGYAALNIVCCMTQDQATWERAG